MTIPELVKLLDTDFAGQPDVLEAAKAAPKMGVVDSATYQAIVSQMDFVYQDLKHHDAAAFREWRGGDLDGILRNVASRKVPVGG